MKKLRLIDTCTQYTTTRNRYGDLELTAGRSLACLYRDISMLNRGVNFREEITATQGIFWFAPDSGIKQGDVVKYGGLLYRMETVTNAKDLLRRNQVQFIKCDASIYRAIS